MNDAWFFIGIFGFIFLIWAATGGPTHPISFSGPYLSAPTPLGSGTYIGLPNAPFALGNSDVQLGNPDTGTGSTYNPNSPSSQLQGVAFGTPSAYRNVITLSSVSSAGSSDPLQESIQIHLSSTATGPVTISGWSLSSGATGNSALIPNGTEVPVSGTVEALAPITLAPGTTALIISGRSPIGGSFRENACIGYFSQYQTFSPSISYKCPDPSAELQSFYGPNYIRDASCIDYVSRLARCTVVLTPPTNLSGSCQSFLENHLNYNGCVQSHQNDSSFKGDTWRVYLGRSSSMWRSSHEVVKLTDNNGDTVAAFAY